MSSSADTKRKCAARQCRVMVLPKYLMCFPHWNKVPRELQTAVWATYFSGLRNKCHPSREYSLAVQAAVQAVALEEAPTPHA